MKNQLLEGIGFHIFIGGQQGRVFPSAGEFTGSSAIPGLGPEVAGHIRHAPITSHRQLVGCGLVDHAIVLGVRANHGAVTARAQTEKGASSSASFFQAGLRKAEIPLAILVFMETEKSTFDNIFKK